jgi:hypothetical protein
MKGPNMSDSAQAAKADPQSAEEPTPQPTVTLD